MTGVVYGEETAPRYEYDYNAKGQVARIRDNLLNRTTQSEYDLANRPVRVKTAEAGQHVYTGQVAYDNVYGNLSEFTEKVGENRQEFGTKFGYDDENRPTSLTYSIGATTIGQSTTTIDKLNRTTFSAVKLGSKTFTSEYHFAAGGYGTGSVTNLVSSITQPGCNCGYGYDDNGNIASATLNGKWTGYTYDELGQLIQVNDHSDTRSGENGTTWKYTYDLGGNILKKERFAYADTTTPLETVTYTYGDANWRDKLTAVNGNAIRYDAIGNPLNDGTWTYTWQNGRQLQKMQKSGVTAEFVYNADELRVQKTVNGVATKYTLHGKNIVHMTSGTDELHIFYDAQNRPAVVVYNGTAYAYVKSLQGDIVAILDENGNTVVSYGYDAWGAPIGKSGTFAETLGKVQPFRYRGYVFDEEMGLYYLRSRYYNPRWGRFINSDVLLCISKTSKSINQFAYCANNPVIYCDDAGTDYRLVGIGIQLDGSIGVDVGNLSAAVGGGLELIVYFDEQMMVDGQPIVAIYSYYSLGGNVSISASEMEQLIEQLAPTIEQLTAIAPKVQMMSTDQIKKVGVTGSLSTSVIFLFGNEGFEDELSYEGPFYTQNYQAGKLKAFLSESESCYAVGAGYDFLASRFTLGYSRSYSDYQCLYSSTKGLCVNRKESNVLCGN